MVVIQSKLLLNDVNMTIGTFVIPAGEFSSTVFIADYRKHIEISPLCLKSLRRSGISVLLEISILKKKDECHCKDLGNTLGD